MNNAEEEEEEGRKKNKIKLMMNEEYNNKYTAVIIIIVTLNARHQRLIDHNHRSLTGSIPYLTLHTPKPKRIDLNDP